MSSPYWITIHDVARAINVELSDDVAWSIGNRLSAEWAKLHDGNLPENVLRRKKNGGGSHHFAAYPPSWFPKITQLIDQYETEAAKQGDLFA